MVGSSKKMVSLNAEREMLRWQCAHQVKLREKSVGLFANLRYFLEGGGSLGESVGHVSVSSFRKNIQIIIIIFAIKPCDKIQVRTRIRC
jgi:hypothetical protein